MAFDFKTGSYRMKGGKTNDLEISKNLISKNKNQFGPETAIYSR